MSNKGVELFSYQSYLILYCFSSPVEKSTFWRCLSFALYLSLSPLAFGQQDRSILDRNSSLSGSARLAEANQWVKKQKWNEAARLLRELRDQNPQEISTAYALASVLTRLGQRTEAVHFLQQLAEQSQGLERARIISKSLILSRTFVTNGSFERFQEALSAFLAKKYRIAQDKFERVLIDEPQNCEVLIKLGQCLTLEDEIEGAIEKFLMAKAINPLDSEVSLWLGKAYLALSNSKDALQEFKSLDAKLRLTEVAVLALAEAQVLAGAPSLALKTLHAELEKNPFHVQALWYSAKIKLLLLKPEHDGLWSARKDLQLALSRLASYDSMERPEWELTSGVYRTSSELKLEIQTLFEQVQSKIEESRKR